MKRAIIYQLPSRQVKFLFTGNHLTFMLHIRFFTDLPNFMQFHLKTNGMLFAFHKLFHLSTLGTEVTHEH